MDHRQQFLGHRSVFAQKFDNLQELQLHCDIIDLMISKTAWIARNNMCSTGIRITWKASKNQETLAEQPPQNHAWCLERPRYHLVARRGVLWSWWTDMKARTVLFRLELCLLVIYHAQEAVNLLPITWQYNFLDGLVLFFLGIDPIGWERKL